MNAMPKITFFLGARPDSSLPDALAHSSALPAWEPFDPRAVTFVGKFSQKLLTHPRIREFPELAALAHWFRAARLGELEQTRPTLTDAVARGRGLVFHLAPANVDSVAMYSWLIALLAGNVNWVRVSQKPSAQFDFLLTVLQQTLADEAVGLPIAGRVVLFEQLLAAIEGIATVSRQYDDTARRVGDAAHSIRATVEETGQSSALTLQASSRLQALVGQFRVG